MKKGIKWKLAKATGGNYKLNKKALQFKRSWEEVENILNNAMKRKKR